LIGFFIIPNWISGNTFVENAIWYWIGIFGIDILYNFTELVIKFISSKKL